MLKLSTGVKHSLWSLLDAASYPVIYVVTVPLLIRYMGPVVFGFWTVLMALVVVVQLFNFNLGYTAMRHIAEERASGNKGRITDIINSLLRITGIQFTGILLIGSLLAVIVSATNWLGTYSDAFRHGGWCFLLAALVGGLRYFEQVFQNIAKAYEQFRKAAILNIIYRTGVLGTTVCIAVWFPKMIVYVLAGNLLFSIGYLAVYYGCLRQLLPFYKAASIKESGLARRLLRFSIWPWTQTLIIVLTFQADRFWVSAYAGLKEVAAYGLAATMINHLNLIFTAMVAWVSPRIIGMHARGENPEAEYHFIRSLLTFLSISLLLLFYWLSPFLFPVWLGHETYAALRPYIQAFTGFEIVFVQTVMPFLYLNGTGREREATYATLLCCGVSYVFMLGGLWIFQSPVALVRGMTIGACLTVPLFHAAANKYIAGQAQPQAAWLDMIPVLAALGLVYTSSPLWMAVLVLAGGWFFWKHYFIHLSDRTVWKQVLNPEGQPG
jgi:O-antigen/teichoic acid export membrane protein